MRTPDRTHHDIRFLHVVFAASAVVLLGVTVWALLADSRREWKQYQPSGRRRIEQIHLPELTIDYHFCEAARTDRCITCHQNMDGSASADEEPPGEAHPRLDLYVGPDSPHPMSQFGCTICHEGQGSATAFRFASHTPNDMDQRAAWRAHHDWFRDAHWEHPMLARRFFESRCLRCHPDVTDLEPSRRFPDPPAPKLVAGYHLVRQYGCFGCHEINGFGPDGRRVGPDMRLEPSGTMRRVGPNLRDVGTRLDRRFLADWIGRPSRFRPDTRMPRLFGLTDHFEGQPKKTADRLEAAEIGTLAEWLAGLREPVEPVASPPGVTEPASAERGRRLLLTQGCLACHRHDDYPEATGTQGPNLSRLGAKYTSPDSARWLADWLRDPARHAPRTRMPNSRLEPVAVAGTGERGVAKTTDPVADLVAFLLDDAGEKPWTPRESRPVAEAALDELALGHLSTRYSPDEARRILDRGLSGEELEAAADDERALVTPMSRRKKLDYVARRTIAKRGCFGCHDLPGFGAARPIGPALSDWGRKDPSLLAFGKIDELLQADGTADRAATDADVGFFVDALRGRRREGFLWQKLRAPRSFDYRMPADHTFHEWLKMGRFNLDDDEREAIATFVLGLLAKPASSGYVYQPDADARAVIEGRKALDRFACAECHVFELDRWQFSYRPGRFDVPPAIDEFAFMRPEVAKGQLEASTQADAGGLAHAEVIGMPRRDATGRVAVFEGDEEDEQGEPLPMRVFSLWQPTAIDGHAWPAGGADVLLYDDQITKQYPAWGGTAIGPLYAAATADAKAAGTSVPGPEVWSHLPPPLVGEGAKVRPDWLADYLLDPQPIRRAAMMRMPKYTLSPDEAATLVDFFLAHDGASRYPSPPSATGVSPSATAGLPSSGSTTRRDQAMRVLTDRKTFCAKCHVVGDYEPGGATTTVGPNLLDVGGRLRGEYVRRWLARPQATLPYTPMPVNFPPSGEPLGQDLLPGTSREQIDAITDLLENYDEYLREKHSVGDSMK